jgi:Zn-dependent protease
MLKWSLKLFRVFGIQLSVHSTFFVLAGYVAWAGWSDAVTDQWRHPVLGGLVNLVALAVFFTCVVLHELGHALTARRFGVGTPRILLLPIGGMAEFDSIPRKPSSELMIALAGPAVNFAIAALLLIFVSFPGEQIGLLVRSFFAAGEIGGDISMTLPQELLTMNVIMGCFNLVPVFPMDGGRVLRALLATQLSYLRATLYAATVGKVFATTAVVAAVLNGRVQLALLFAFIIFAGEMEYRAVRRRERDEARWRQMLADLEAASARTARMSIAQSAEE